MILKRVSRRPILLSLSSPSKSILTFNFNWFYTLKLRFPTILVELLSGFLVWEGLRSASQQIVCSNNPSMRASILQMAISIYSSSNLILKAKHNSIDNNSNNTIQLNSMKTAIAVVAAVVTITTGVIWKVVGVSMKATLMISPISLVYPSRRCNRIISNYRNPGRLFLTPSPSPFISTDTSQSRRMINLRITWNPILSYSSIIFSTNKIRAIDFPVVVFTNFISTTCRSNLPLNLKK